MPGPIIRPGLGRGFPEIYQYEEGTLIVDLMLGKTRELIWRGIAKGSVDWHTPQEQRNELIEEAVQKVMAQFPPKRSR
jgi:hypothetical protein